MVKFTEKSTHKKPHFEEILTDVLACTTKEGKKAFPGLSEVKGFTFRNPGDPSLDGVKAEERGELMIGIGHGRFDEHPAQGGKRKENECAATLMAKHLGLDQDPGWQGLLHFAILNDLRGQGSPFDIGYLPKVMYPSEIVATSVPVETVLDWEAMAIRAIYTAEKKSAKTGKPFDPEAGLQVFDRAFAAWMIQKCGDPIPGGDIVKYVFSKSKKLTAQEVIEKYSMDEDPAMATILSFFKARPKAENLFDLKGLPYLISKLTARDPVVKKLADRLDLHNANSIKEFAVVWLHLALDSKYNEQVRFIQTGKEYEDKARIAPVQGPDGVELQIAVIDDCDNPLMNKYARYRGAALVIQRQSWGNVQIYTNKKLRLKKGDRVFRLKVHDLAAMIRVQEQEAAEHVETTDWKVLRQEGIVQGCASWYFHEEGQMLLNGSLTAEQPPTQLSLDEILKLAVTALDFNFYPPNRSRQCLSGNCQKAACSWYKWGLQRCQKVRKHRKHTN